MNQAIRNSWLVAITLFVLLFASISYVQFIDADSLNANPSNYFAETEQVAFHLGNLVPGIEVTNDPLLQARLFSYIDTQITRLGGPNFHQIPINRPHAPVNDMLRDGFHQHAVHTGVAPYRPNSLDGGCPFTAGEADGAFVEVPAPVAEGAKVRAAARSFDDHFSQARLFYRSMSPVEQQHITAAYSFELSKCYEQAVRERQLQSLANIDADLCAAVARSLGLPAPQASVEVAESTPSAALSQLGTTYPVDGRKVGVVIDDASDTGLAGELIAAITESKMVPFLIGPHGGTMGELTVASTYATARSFEFDAVVVLGGSPAEDAVPGLDARAAQTSAEPGAAEAAGSVDPRITLLLGEMWRHCKVVAAIGEAGTDALPGAATASDARGAVIDDDPTAVVSAVADLLAAHRVWDRFSANAG